MTQHARELGAGEDGQSADGPPAAEPPRPGDTLTDVFRPVAAQPAPSLLPLSPAPASPPPCRLPPRRPPPRRQPPGARVTARRSSPASEGRTHAFPRWLCSHIVR
jgi:hypothetical protein